MCAPGWARRRDAAVNPANQTVPNQDVERLLNGLSLSTLVAADQAHEFVLRQKMRRLDAQRLENHGGEVVVVETS